MNLPATGRFVFRRAELWADGVIHVLGVALGLGAVAVLIVQVANSAPLFDLIPVSIYSAALLAVLIVSATYNMWPISPRKWFIRRFDHSAIYVLIAGTYTPFLMKLSGSFFAPILLAVVWFAAAAGVVIKVVLPGRFDRLSIVLYLMIGWSGLLIWESVSLLPATTLWLIVAGGLLYSIGVIFHVWESLPFQNAIWHGFVLVASGCFYGAVFRAYAIAPTV
ncbi:MULTISPECIES: hemolysin III family protein [Bosea]|uniref:PAQR family membrane homeostasis protein TrhA n=1 Tax=Bosea TaxID=85413 RepID=UPI00214F7B9D|nr:MULTISPECIES: hemolysin III family protein [Bosea]MCR4520895.1 hemolysin III family protein [Bosea sp. 47.2.35]MDR6827585.1 hemolysin III [Bosea robiniae]MDR6894295.1 hemolysin III [Bosea sp. BE109]MDR7137691.1 hemolysin III [Bosea sp. BE168]MDR7174390.1 hemolysin III [Bosea sp. BE271]